MNEWELLKQVAESQDSQDELSKLIIENDLKGQVADCALEVFEITEKNINKNKKAATKLSNIKDESLSFRSELRRSIIKEILSTKP